MSLRSEIHAAYDELGPTPAFLADRVLNTVVDAAPARRTMRRWVLGVRPPLALVAALVVVALVVGALLGGRLFRDWNNFVNPPVPGGHSSQFLKQLHELEARPFHPAMVGEDATCPYGPFNRETGWYGAGPVYLETLMTQGMGGSTITPWGLYVQYNAMTDPTLSGPVLFRAEDLRTGEALLFVGNYVAGPQVGTDVVEGVSSAQHSEVALDAGAPPKVRNSGYYVWPIEAGMYLTAADRQLIGAPAGAGVAFCWAWQVDGPDFSEKFDLGL